MIFLFFKYRHLFYRELEQHYSDISHRDFHGFGWLAIVMVVTYIFDMMEFQADSHQMAWLIFAQLSDCICALIITWRVDQQQLIVWDTPQEDETLSPVIVQLGKKLDSLMEEQSLFLNSDFSRDDLVTALSTNRTYLNLVLSARGLTFYQYINHLRIDYACQRIQTSSDTLSIKDIAVACGFNNPESFTRQFKAIIGVTPSEYAKNPTPAPLLSPPPCSQVKSE